MEDILTWAHTVLTTTPTRWTELAGKVPAELLTRPPAPGEWSAQACLQHLVDTERWVFPARIEAMLAGRDFAAFDPDSQGTKAEEAPAAEQLANEFARLRADNLRLLQTVTPADLKRQARHQELGLVTLAELLHHWAGHDLMHTVQAERALLQPFIQGCGPWQAYFSDHTA
ncbi:MAG TPA: DinB family protein [Anaerolineae bacterium]|nr:DinB family protein [Anaerolineae bacterium]HMR65563.1 DinB family protein [Anaerolineae bacterium]